MSYNEPDSVVGKPAHVTLPIPGDDKPGEVLVQVRGGTEIFIAYCDQALAVGAQVVVLADRGARTLLVAPL
jgi:membrane protein implicated in regulation of membrane protease activity